MEFLTTGISGNYLIGSGSAAQDWYQVNLVTAYSASGSTGNLSGIRFTRMDDNFVDYWIDDVTLLASYGPPNYPPPWITGACFILNRADLGTTTPHLNSR